MITKEVVEEWMRENNRKVVARHKKTGSEYTYIKETPYGNMYKVLTGIAEYKFYTPWLVSSKDIEIL